MKLLTVFIGFFPQKTYNFINVSQLLPNSFSAMEPEVAPQNVGCTSLRLFTWMLTLKSFNCLYGETLLFKYVKYLPRENEISILLIAQVNQYSEIAVTKWLALITEKYLKIRDKGPDFRYFWHTHKMLQSLLIFLYSTDIKGIALYWCYASVTSLVTYLNACSGNIFNFAFSYSLFLCHWLKSRQGNEFFSQKVKKERKSWNGG